VEFGDGLVGMRNEKYEVMAAMSNESVLLSLRNLNRLFFLFFFHLENNVSLLQNFF